MGRFSSGKYVSPTVSDNMKNRKGNRGMGMTNEKKGFCRIWMRGNFSQSDKDGPAIPIVRAL